MKDKGPGSKDHWVHTYNQEKGKQFRTIRTYHWTSFVGLPQVFQEYGLPFQPTFAETSWCHKLSLWHQRLEAQRNSINSPSDGIRKFLNRQVVRSIVEDVLTTPQEKYFHLCHPDLHSKNVFVKTETWKITASSLP